MRTLLITLTDKRGNHQSLMLDTRARSPQDQAHQIEVLTSNLMHLLAENRDTQLTISLHRGDPIIDLATGMPVKDRALEVIELSPEEWKQLFDPVYDRDGRNLVQELLQVAEKAEKTDGLNDLDMALQKMQGRLPVEVSESRLAEVITDLYQVAQAQEDADAQDPKDAHQGDLDEPQMQDVVDQRMGVTITAAEVARAATEQGLDIHEIPPLQFSAMVSRAALRARALPSPHLNQRAGTMARQRASNVAIHRAVETATDRIARPMLRRQDDKDARKAREFISMLREQRTEARALVGPKAREVAHRNVEALNETTKRHDRQYMLGDMAIRSRFSPAYRAALLAASPDVAKQVSEHALVWLSELWNPDHDMQGEVIIEDMDLEVEKDVDDARAQAWRDVRAITQGLVSNPEQALNVIHQRAGHNHYYAEHVHDLIAQACEEDPKLRELVLKEKPELLADSPVQTMRHKAHSESPLAAMRMTM